jgi:AcrR family transcriptional regulator
MRLKAQVRREQLISTAMRLFSLQGFDGTTTREIANAAGVNEAIIFRHFPTKEDLYWAVISSRIASAGRQRRIREHLEATDDPQQALRGVALILLDRNEEDAAITRLLLFSALRNPKLTENFFRTYMSGTYRVLADYIRKGVESGRFRKVNPQNSARTFIGMISNHILVQELFGGDRRSPIDPKTAGAGLADLWLNGVSNSPSKAVNRNGRVRGANHNSSSPRRKQPKQIKHRVA